MPSRSAALRTMRTMSSSSSGPPDRGRDEQRTFCFYNCLAGNRSYTHRAMPGKSTKTRPPQGMRLAELRKNADLSQYELARYSVCPRPPLLSGSAARSHPLRRVAYDGPSPGASASKTCCLSLLKSHSRKKQLSVTAGLSARYVRSSIASQGHPAVSRNTSSIGSLPTSLSRANQPS
jgi:hypothetical protein